MFIFNKKSLLGVVEIIPERHQDKRGFFSELLNYKELKKHGLNVEFIQENHSLSTHSGTVRGLHFQAPPFAQAKLVRCGRGKIIDVAVDIRIGSPTYGQWVTEELTFENGKQLYIPEGFLHGFVTLEPNSEIIYKCTNFYNKSSEGCVRFNDPDLKISWGKSINDHVISTKDRDAVQFEDFKSPFAL